MQKGQIMQKHEVGWLPLSFVPKIFTSRPYLNLMRAETWFCAVLPGKHLSQCKRGPEQCQLAIVPHSDSVETEKLSRQMMWCKRRTKESQKLKCLCKI